MWRPLWIVGAVAVALTLGACGGDTTTVVNNTTTVNERAEPTTTTPTVNDGDCGDIGKRGPDGLGLYNVAATDVDCNEAQALAERWVDSGCYESASDTCTVDSYACIRVFGDQGAILNCKEDPRGDAGVKFEFASLDQPQVDP